jgi:integrase
VQVGEGARSVLHYHRIVGAALHQGERWGWIDRNVTKLATPPTLTRTNLTVPPPDRVQALIELASSSRAPEMATIVTIAALTGLRRGELCGLRWRDVDWDDRSVAVRRSVWQAGAGWGVKDPKAHQERRLVIGDQTIRVLSERRQRAEAVAALTEVALSEEAYVFSLDAGGSRPMLPDTVTSRFAKLCRRMEALAAQADPSRKESWPYRFHDLRHYSATQPFRSGHDPRTVAARLGHADRGALALRVYAHDTEDQARAAAASLEAGLSWVGP